MNRDKDRDMDSGQGTDTDRDSDRVKEDWQFCKCHTKKSLNYCMNILSIDEITAKQYIFSEIVTSLNHLLWKLSHH